MSMFDPSSPNFDPSLIPNPDNGLVQLAGIAGIESPPDANLNDNAAGRIIASCVVLMVLSFIAVFLRFLARRLARVNLWWDDWTILAAMLMAWGSCICMLVAINLGFGRHAAYYPSLFQRVYVAQSYFKVFYAYELLYCFAVALCKYSILLFYGRIFTERPFRIALYIMHTLVTLWLVSIGLAVLTECVPIQGLWELSDAARCINLKSFFVGAGIPNVLLNVTIVFLPVPMIWTLDIDRKHRLALSGVFGLGAFVIAVSIARVVVLGNISLTDITWNFVDAGIWTSVEPSIAVVSACLPILRSLWVWKRKRFNARATDTMQTKSRSPIHSFHEVATPSLPKQYTSTKSFAAKYDRKNRHDSFTAPINELPTDDSQWGATTEGYSNTPSRATSTRKFRYTDEDIDLHDLPIQKQDLPSEKSSFVSSKPLPVARPQMYEKKEHVAELYGS